VAISNHRLVSFTDGKVTFRWRDSAHNNEQKFMTLPLDEFLRRFLLHVLPKVLCASGTSVSWPTGDAPRSCRFAFNCSAPHKKPQAKQDVSSTNDSHDLWRCPKCGGPMVVVEKLTAAEIQLRSPPLLTAA